jgi:hypothetical protein
MKEFTGPLNSENEIIKIRRTGTIEKESVFKVDGSVIAGILYYTVITGMVYALGCAVSLLF